MNRLIVCLGAAACLSLGACAVTGPADDGFATSQESLSTGRLFSDDESGYTVWKSRDDSAGDNDAPSAEAADFAAFEEWRKARDNDTPEYRKFRLWQQFEAFERWREQQDPD